jgi:16S rRNA (uracil1498-N3)-methyltransferase
VVPLDAAAHVFVGDLDALELADDDHHHLARVLRLRAGEAVTASDGRGHWRWCVWSGDGVTAAGEVETESEPVPRITVGFVVPKGDRPEWIVQKLTECGVDEIVPLTSARSVVRWDAAKAGRQHERLERIAREAAVQSRRVWLPAVRSVTALSEMMTNAVGGRFALANPGGESPSLDCPTILVGPEGGWDRDEIAGQRLVGLGSTVLRAETAAVAAGFLLSALRTGIVSPPC